MTLEPRRKFFEKYSNMKFYEKLSGANRVVACERADTTNVAVASAILRTRLIMVRHLCFR